MADALLTSQTHNAPSSGAPSPGAPPSGAPPSGAAVGRGAVRGTPAERKVVTLLFADIVESSAMVSGRDPEDADSALLSILQVLADAVGRYNGTVAQMLGDGMMAVFGAPSALEDHALRACLAAQDIARAAIESDTFKVRVGISSGEVVAQIVESGVWSDYRTVGETVHIAAKLQQRAKPNSVLLSQETLDLVPTGLVVHADGTLRLAAGAEPVPVYALESARAMRRTAMDLLSSDGTLFVGRAGELALLNDALRQAEDGSGRLILLTGEAGIGKSRLTGELTRGPQAARFGLLNWPQYPIRRLGEPDDLEAVARSLAFMVAGRVDGRAVSLVAAAAERGGGELAAEAMRELLGVPSVHPLWSGLDPAQRADFSIEGLVAAVADLSFERPLLILVEDAHWARGLTPRLLNALADAVEDSRVVVLVTSRPDFSDGWTPPDSVPQVALNPLDGALIEEFLDHWLGFHPSVADLKARVAAQSEGFPLYLEESLRALESAGVIVGSPGRYEAGDADAKLLLPPTVHGLLASRIDRLEPIARRTLLHAAVIGPSVDLELLRQIAPVPSSDLPDILTRLESEGFLTRSRLLPNLETSFRHAMVQEVAYATMTRRERQPLHGRILRALRARHERDLPGRTELMAHHAFLAEDWPAACAYGRRAGQRAEAHCKHADAGRFYHNALKALDQLPDTRRYAQRRIDLWIAIPRILLPQGGRGADDMLELARALAQDLGDRGRYARASSLLASFQWVYGDLESAKTLSLEALAALECVAGRESRIQLIVRLAGALAEQGNFSEADAALRDANDAISDRDSYGRYGLTVIAAVCIASYRSRCVAELGDSEEALRLAGASVDLAEESGHAFSIALANLHLGLANLICQKYENAVKPLKAALTVMETIRLYVYQPLTLGALGFAMTQTGTTGEDGTALLHASLEHARMLKIFRHEPQILIWTAESSLTSKCYDNAVAYATEASVNARSAGQSADEAWACLTLAKALLGAGRIAESHAALTTAETLARQRSMETLLRASALIHVSLEHL